ncbi:MAG: glycosyltransferase family 4 protein [Patescibacteria group bacterium]|nr:glycosyltransferase family 4 protein [Patescibacteria group bacterium]
MGKPAAEPLLKIGIVFDDSLDKPDGVQQYILSLGSWLSQQGHEVHYLVGQTKRTDIKNVHSLSRNIGVTFNGNQLSIPLPTAKGKLRRLLAVEKFDVLHVQVPYSPWLAHRIIMAAPSNTTIIGTFHIVAFSRLVQLATRGLAFWTRRSLRRFSKVVSVSSAAVDYARATYGISTTVVPNVFDYDRFHTAQPLLPAQSTMLRILYLGRLVERKGCRDLLQAIKYLVERGVTGFTVVICGKGPLLSELEQFSNRHQLPVEFTGFVAETDKPGYYASADIAVFPSTGGESFGIVLLEAMASGRAAVLAASNSGYASVMADRPDLLFKPKDSLALARLLEDLISQPHKRTQAAAWGLNYSQKFDVPIIGQQLLTSYRLPPA